MSPDGTYFKPLPPLTEEQAKHLARRFWSKVRVGKINGDACWEWQGGLYTSGYGQFGLNNQPYAAHRIAFWLETGDWPDLCILHHCDNPKCCNPSHLFTGTHADNARDKVAKGRQDAARGVQHYKARLSPSQVREIRAKYRPHEYGANRLAREYGVAKGTIWAITAGKSWKHVTGEAPPERNPTPCPTPPT